MTWRLDQGWVRLEGDLPDGVDRKELLRALGRGLVATKRFRKLLVGGARPDGAATVRVRVESEQGMFGRGYGFAFTVVGADGATIVEHPAYSMTIVPPSDLHHHAEDAALVLADEQLYPSLVRARGHSGDLSHPRLSRIAPANVLALAVCALQNGQAQGLRNTSALAHEAATAARDPADRCRLRRMAADLAAGLGDLKLARASLARALLDDAPAPEEAEGLRLRLSGLAAQRALGPMFVPALLAAGRALVTTARTEQLDELFRATAALAAAGCPPLVGSEEELERLFQQGGLMSAVAARFGFVAGATACLGQALAFAAWRRERLDASVLQPARPLLEQALGAEAVDAATEALGAGDVARALAALAPAEQRFAARRELWDAERVRREGRVDEAVAALERLVRRDPRDADAHAALALAHAQAGRLEQTVAALRAAVKLGPDRVADLVLLAAILRDAGDPTYEEPLRAGLALDPHDAQALLVRGCARAEAGQVDGACEDFTAVAALAGADPTLAYNLGTALLNGGRHEEALPHLTAAAETPGAPPEWRVNRGICLRRLRRHREAIRELSAGYAAKPSLVNALGHLGLARAAVRDPAARRDLEAYLRAQPQGSLADEVRAAL